MCSDFDAVSARFLGDVQFLVGYGKEVFYCEARFGKRGNPRAEGYLEFLSVVTVKHHFSKFLVDPIEDHARGSRAFSVEGHGKLFAPPAASRIHGSSATAEETTKSGEYPISGQVAVGIVDHFEMV